MYEEAKVILGQALAEPRLVLRRGSWGVSRATGYWVPDTVGGCLLGNYLVGKKSITSLSSDLFAFDDCMKYLAVSEEWLGGVTLGWDKRNYIWPGEPITPEYLDGRAFAEQMAEKYLPIGSSS